MKKLILITATLFAGLLLFYLVFEGDAPEQAGVLQGERFLPLKTADIHGLKIVTQEGLTFKCLKDTDGSWNIIEGERKAKSSEKIHDFLEAITSITELDYFSVHSTMLTQYGLQDPSIRITLTDRTQKIYEVLVGDKTPTDSTGVYVKLADTDRIAILGAVFNWELYKLSSLFVFQEKQ